jgi:hypothetical protein
MSSTNSEKNGKRNDRAKERRLMLSTELPGTLSWQLWYMGDGRVTEKSVRKPKVNECFGEIRMRAKQTKASRRKRERERTTRVLK